MAWISFGALPCRKKETWWQLASPCCWNHARPWHASEIVSFLVGLRTYQFPGIYILLFDNDFSVASFLYIWRVDVAGTRFFWTRVASYTWKISIICTHKIVPWISSYFRNFPDNVIGAVSSLNEARRNVTRFFMSVFYVSVWSWWSDITYTEIALKWSELTNCNEISVSEDAWTCKRKSRVPCIVDRKNITILYSWIGPTSWSSGQGIWLLIMRSRVRFPVLPWEFFLPGKDSRGDHGLGS